MQRVIATVCVRIGSERLPGKVLREIAGKPMLGLLLDRALQAQGLDGVVVATAESSENDGIATYCASRGVACFRGSEDDVAGRMLGALEAQRADIGVQLYGDSPLIDPSIIDLCIAEFRKGSWDWVGNDLRAGYPSGFFAEAFSVSAFRAALSTCDDPAIREHGTLCLRRDAERFKILHLDPPAPLNRPEICLSVDSPEDLELLQAIMGNFAPRSDFSAEEILDFLDAHPEVTAVNQEVHRRWKKYQQN